jgi:elongation factor 2
MMACNKDGRFAMVVTRIHIDKHAGEIASGRIFSGIARLGDEVHVVGAKTKRRIQQVGIYMGPDRINIEGCPCGNIVALTGIKEAIAGETLCSGDPPIVPFEAIKHYSEPVVTVAVEPQNTKDLAKLIEVMRQVSKEDPTLQVKINEETGEYLLSGMGELHLEITEYRIQKNKGVPIKTSEPIVVYRETVEGTSPEVEGKSPNKHNKFYIIVEPLEDDFYEAIKSGDISEGRVKGKELDVKLRGFGYNKEEVKGIEDIYEGNVLLEVSRGVVQRGEVIELILEAFHEVIGRGPLASEPVTKLKIKIVDMKLHEDSIHRGPAQVIPAVRDAINGALLLAQATLVEPMQKLFIQAPQDYMGAITREIQGRRGQIMEMSQEEEIVTIVSKVPVADMFGFTSSVRSATEGRALWTTEFAGFEKVPPELQGKVIMDIRKRKGMKLEMPKPQDYLGV